MENNKKLDKLFKIRAEVCRQDLVNLEAITEEEALKITDKEMKELANLMEDYYNEYGWVEDLRISLTKLNIIEA